MNSEVKTRCPLCGSDNTETYRKAFPAYGQKFMDYWITVVKCDNCQREWSPPPPEIVREGYDKTKIVKMINERRKNE